MVETSVTLVDLVYVERKWRDKFNSG